MGIFTLKFDDGTDQDFTIDGDVPTSAEQRNIQSWATKNGKGLGASKFAGNEFREGLSGSLNLLGPQLYGGADFLLGGLLPDRPKQGRFGQTGLLKSDPYAAPATEGARLAGRLAGVGGASLPFAPVAATAPLAFATSALGAGIGEYVGETLPGSLSEPGQIIGGLLGGTVSPTLLNRAGAALPNVIRKVPEAASRAYSFVKDLPKVFTEGGRAAIAERHAPKSFSEAVDSLTEQQRLFSENAATREIQDLVSNEPQIFGPGGVMEQRRALMAETNAAREAQGLPPVSLNIAELTGSPTVERFMTEPARHDIGRLTALRGQQATKQQSAALGTKSAMQPPKPAATGEEIVGQLRSQRIVKESDYLRRSDELAAEKQRLMDQFPSTDRLGSADAMRRYMEVDRNQRAATIGAKFAKLDEEIAQADGQASSVVDLGEPIKEIRKLYSPKQDANLPTELKRMIDDAAEGDDAISIADAKERYSFLSAAIRKAERGDSTLDPRAVAVMQRTAKSLEQSINSALDDAIDIIPNGREKYGSLRGEWRQFIQEHDIGISGKLRATGGFGEDMIHGDKAAQSLLSSEQNVARFMLSASKNPEQLQAAQDLVMDFAARKMFPGGQLSESGFRSLNRYKEQMSRLGLGRTMDDSEQAVTRIAESTSDLVRRRRALDSDTILSQITDPDSADVGNFLKTIGGNKEEATKFLEAVNQRDLSNITNLALKDERTMGKLLTVLDDGGARGMAREIMSKTSAMSPGDRVAFLDKNKSVLELAMRRGYGKDADTYMKNLYNAARMESLIADYSKLGPSQAAISKEFENKVASTFREFGTSVPSVTAAFRSIIAGRGGAGHFGSVFTLQAMNAVNSGKRAEMLNEIFSNPDMFDSRTIKELYEVKSLTGSADDMARKVKLRIARQHDKLMEEMKRRGYYSGIIVTADQNRRNQK